VRIADSKPLSFLAHRSPTKTWYPNVDEWGGNVTNAAPEEHDAIGWFTLAEAQQQPLANESYRELLARVLT